jgi:hypothetical protein
MHKRNREWAKSQNKKSVTNTTSNLIHLPDYQHSRNEKPYRSRARKRARSCTRFLRLPLLIGLKLVVNLLPVQSLGLMRLLEAVPHHGCTSVSIRDVRHSRISPVRSCSSGCCSWHCRTLFSLLLLIHNEWLHSKPPLCKFLACSRGSNKSNHRREEICELSLRLQNLERNAFRLHNAHREV